MYNNHHHQIEVIHGICPALCCAASVKSLGLVKLQQADFRFNVSCRLPHTKSARAQRPRLFLTHVYSHNHMCTATTTVVAFGGQRHTQNDDHDPEQMHNAVQPPPLLCLSNHEVSSSIQHAGPSTTKQYVHLRPIFFTPHCAAPVCMGQKLTNIYRCSTQLRCGKHKA